MNRLVFVCAFLLFAATAWSQGFFITEFDTSNFPAMKAKFFSFDANHVFVHPQPGDVRIIEDGVQRTVTGITCPPSQPEQKFSVAMSLDISGSMLRGDNGGIPIELGKTTMASLVPIIADPASDFALQTCNTVASIVQDFTTDRATFLSKISTLKADGGNNFDEHLLNPQAGLLNVARTGQHRRIAILYTDAWWNALAPDKLQECKDICSRNGIVFYALIYSQSDGDGIKASLQELAKATGGELYAGIDSKQAAIDIASRIHLSMNSVLPCEISWQSDLPCADKLLNIDVQWNGISSSLQYFVPETAYPVLQISPYSLIIHSKPLGLPFDTVVTVTGLNQPVTVTNITSTNPAFDINPKSFSLAVGGTQNLTIRYTPIDSGYSWTKFDFSTNKCPRSYFASGGFPGLGPKLTQLKLVTPNGTEKLIVGTDTAISWSGISLTDTVRLDYSIDGGANWIPITDKASGGSYPWHVPNTPSATCLVRVSQFPYNGFGSSDSIVKLIGHTNYVSAVCWNPDGSEVATVSSDESIRTWDAATGKQHLLIPATVGSSYAVAWSPDGKTIATGDTGGDIIFFDSKTGKEIKRFNDPNYTGPPGGVSYVAWSPDGSRIASVGDGNTAKIWDAKTGALKTTVTLLANQNYLGHGEVAWSPDGLEFVSGFGENNTTSAIWNASSGSKIKTLAGHTWNQVVDWSQDGSLVATAGLEFAAYLWNPISGALVRTIPKFNSVITSIHFSPDSKKILTTGSGPAFIAGKYYAQVWDVATGALQRTFLPDSSAAFASWSPDGTRIAIANNDFTGTIWYYNGAPSIPLQQDTSDAVFSIVAPQAVSEDVDMGSVLVSASKDSSIQDFIKNTGTYDLRVDSIRITGANASEFTVLSGIPPFSVSAGSIHHIEFLFAPLGTGVRTASVSIYVQGVIITQSLKGFGVAPMLSVLNDLIDFGTIFVSAHKDSLHAVTIKNIGSSPLLLTGVRSGGPNTMDFPILSGVGSFTLQPGDTAKVDLRFAPSDVGRTSGILLFYYSGAGSPASVRLFGQGVLSTASAMIGAGDASGYPGDSIEIPILLLSDTMLAQSGATELTANLRFNSSLLFPIGMTPKGTVTGNQRMISITIPVSPEKGNILALLPFRVMLGTDTMTTLDLNNPASIGGVATIQSSGGIFHLLGTCTSGGARLYNPDGQVSMAHVNPNPANGIIHIEIQTTETGRTQLTFMNLLGQKITTISDGELKPGSHSFDVNTNSLSAGSYFLMMQTPTVRRMQRVDVEK